MPRRLAVPGEVPFLHEKQIEREADLLLAEYVERMSPISEPPIPLEELVGLLNLRHQFLDMKSLFPFADVHGAIWFEKALIGVDASLHPDSHPRHLGRYHFTLAHEIGHWRLHRQHYIVNPAERLLFDDGSPKSDVVCRSSERKKPVEWQADSFAAYLLMPRQLVLDAWQTFRGSDVPIYLTDLCSNVTALHEADDPIAINLLESTARPLATRFEVSPEAMRIRLESLKLLQRKKEPSLFD